MKLPEILFGPGSQNYFQNNTKMLFATMTVPTCLNTNQGSRHEITRSHCILHCHTLWGRKKMGFYQRMSLSGYKRYEFYYILTLDYVPFSYSMWWNWKYTQHTSAAPQRLCDFELQAELATSPWITSFTQMTRDKLWLFITGYVAAIFLKMN